MCELRFDDACTSICCFLLEARAMEAISTLLMRAWGKGKAAEQAAASTRLIDRCQPQCRQCSKTKWFGTCRRRPQSAADRRMPCSPVMMIPVWRRPARVTSHVGIETLNKCACTLAAAPPWPGTRWMLDMHPSIRRRSMKCNQAAFGFGRSFLVVGALLSDLPTLGALRAEQDTSTYTK